MKLSWRFRGHLRAGEFVNLMDGVELYPGRHQHLEGCARCGETLSSMQALRRRVTESTADADPVEPDWDEFRAGVRGALLSRSVRREQSRSRWLGGLAWRPALAMGLSVTFVVALTSQIVRWNPGGGALPFSGSTPEMALESLDIALLQDTDVIDELLQLSEAETDSLQRLLQDLRRPGAQSR